VTSPQTQTKTVQIVASSAEAKVVAAVGGVLAVVFAIHPGWNQSGLASGIESAASAIVGGAIYFINLVTARKG
jgi:hypothetical protein